jgi:hypothetical protein
MIEIIKNELTKFYQEERGNRVTVHNVEGLMVRLLTRLEAENVDEKDGSHNPGQ